MRNMCLGITAFVVTVGMVSAGAQGRNFSGTWVIDSEKTMAAAQAAMGEMASAVTARGGGGARGGRGSGTGEVVAGGGGVAVGGTVVARSGGGGGGGGVAAAGSGARGGRGGGVGVAADTVITMDASTFTLDSGGFQTSYPINGTEATVQTRSGTAKARASWKGDTLVIDQTIDSPNGPVTSTTSWFLEGDSLVRLTTRRTYFKRK
jgi:hypothetical protein